MPTKPGRSLQFRLPSLARTAAPRHYLTVVAVVKNEAAYIVEWLAFHRLVGVEHFFIYDNGSTDGTREILAAPDITWLPWPDFIIGKLWQRTAYAHAFHEYGGASRWMAVIDVDEFIYPTAANTIPDVLGEMEEWSAVSLPWRMFGNSGHATKPDGLVIANYTMRAPSYSDPLDKVIVDPTRVAEIGVHAFTPPEATLHEPNELALNHYYTKSDAELIERLAVGLVGHSGVHPYREQKLRLAAEINRAAIPDTGILRFVSSVERSLSEMCERWSEGAGPAFPS